MYHALRKPALIAVFVALVPFAGSCTFETAKRDNGVLVEYTFFDLFALVCAIGALYLAVSLVRLARKEGEMNNLVAAVAAVVVLVGLFQGVKGAGVIVDRSSCRSDAYLANGFCKPTDR